MLEMFKFLIPKGANETISIPTEVGIQFGKVGEEYSSPPMVA